jgi:hypothetical protein
MNMDVIVFMDWTMPHGTFDDVTKYLNLWGGYSIHVSKIYHKVFYQFGWNVLLGSHSCSPTHQTSIKPNF